MIDLDAIQSRLDRGVESLTDTYDLLREVERLRQLLLNAGWPREAEGVAELAAGAERAAVVAWLRAEAVAFAGTRTEQGVQRAKSLTLAADNIERGEHRREEEE